MTNATPDAGVQAAVDRYRDIAKWLIGVFAAVGALLAAGSQLSTLGELDLHRDWLRLLVAAVALAVAVGMTISVIASALQVLQPLPTSLDDVVADGRLVTELERNPDRLPFGATSVRAAVAAYGRALNDPLRTDGEKQEWRDGRDTFLGEACVAKARQRFERAWKRMAWCAVAASVGILIFAYAANPSSPSPPSSSPATAPTVIRPRPVEAQIHLTKFGQHALRSELGAACARPVVTGLVIGGSRTSPEVVTLPNAGCHSVQLNLSPQFGVAIARTAG